MSDLLTVLTKIVSILLVPAVGTAIVYRHARDLFGSFFKGFLVYAIEAVGVRLFVMYPVATTWKFIMHMKTNDASVDYLLFAFISAVVLSYVFVVLHKYFSVRLNVEKDDSHE